MFKKNVSFLFNWDNIPGNDNERLIEFISQKFGIEWIKTAKIEKIDDGKTIRATNGKNYISLRLNDKRTRVNFESYGGTRAEFIARMENGKLNIYRGSLISAILWMTILSILLGWIWLIGPLIAGYVGGKKAGNVSNAVKAVALPALLISIVIYMIFIGEFLTGAAFLFVITYDFPLLIGAVIGGLSA